DEVDALANLDDRVERVLRYAVGHLGIRVIDGKLHFDLVGSGWDTSKRAILLRSMIDLASALADAQTRGSRRERLLHKVLTDENPQVRYRCLALLVRRYPRSESSRTAARAALKMNEPSIRLLAAGFLGEEGFEDVRQIAENDCPERLPALRHLIAYF